jgi:hypothetical protein
VVGEHLAPLVVGQQVPLVGADERVDADVVARVLAGQERRDVALVEFGGPVARDVAPHGLACAAQGGDAAEVGVDGLEGFDARRVRPDHEVGVGAQSGDVVEAADHDALVGLTFAKSSACFDHRFSVVSEDTGFHLEHREHEVADLRVERVKVRTRQEAHGTPDWGRAPPRSIAIQQYTKADTGIVPPGEGEIDQLATDSMAIIRSAVIGRVSRPLTISLWSRCRVLPLLHAG